MGGRARPRPAPSRSGPRTPWTPFRHIVPAPFVVGGHATCSLASSTPAGRPRRDDVRGAANAAGGQPTSRRRAAGVRGDASSEWSPPASGEMGWASSQRRICRRERSRTQLRPARRTGDLVADGPSELEVGSDRPGRQAVAAPEGPPQALPVPVPQLLASHQVPQAPPEQSPLAEAQRQIDPEDGVCPPEHEVAGLPGVAVVDDPSGRAGRLRQARSQHAVAHLRPVRAVAQRVRLHEGHLQPKRERTSERRLSGSARPDDQHPAGRGGASGGADRGRKARQGLPTVGQRRAAGIPRRSVAGRPRETRSGVQRGLR